MRFKGYIFNSVSLAVEDSREIEGALVLLRSRPLCPLKVEVSLKLHCLSRVVGLRYHRAVQRDVAPGELCKLLQLINRAYVQGIRLGVIPRVGASLLFRRLLRLLGKRREGKSSRAENKGKNQCYNGFCAVSHIFLLSIKDRLYLSK